ncbi:unnamed protein product [Adineta steineri]|nr:unnamed protein product [Adineta steineri]
MVNENTIKRLVSFINNLEEKLTSVQSIHDKLQELMTIVSTTHENIVDELSNIKNVLNEITNDQQDKKKLDNYDEKPNQSKLFHDEKHSPINHENNDSSLNSSSLISENSSYSKKINPSSRLKLSKSVSFSLDKNILNQRLSREPKSEIFDEISVPIFPSSSDLLKHNQMEISPVVGKILTNIRIHEIEPKNGDYLRLLNISNSDQYDLSGHFLQQNTASKPLHRFRFPFNTIIQPGQTITIWCANSGKHITPQPPYVFVWKEQRTWETGPECLTILAKPNGQSIAWFRNSPSVNTDQSSSDILLLHSKSNPSFSDVSNTSLNSFRNSSRLSARQSRVSSFNSFGNNKPPFAHSPNSPIHPDHNGTNRNTSNDLRSQINQRVGLSHLYPRSKSSSYAGYSGSKQDLNLSQTEQKQTTMKT